MFEAEIEMEKRSAFLPLVLMTCLVAGIVGMVTYVVFQVRAKTPLSTEQASVIVKSALQGPGAAIINFHTGLIKPSVNEQPEDSHYRLLEKAGILKLVKSSQGKVLVSLTPGGERLVTGIAGFKKFKETDGTFAYQVPLAERQFVSITSITMNGVNNAAVEYTWKWVPNQMGDIFDAGGSLVKGFNLWDRQSLIDKFEADFYHGNPTKSTLAFVRSDRGWKITGQ